MYEFTLNTENNETEPMPGAELARTGSRSHTTLISVQIIPSGDGDFELQIQGGVISKSGVKYTRFGTFTQDDETLLTPIHISQGCNYKIFHISGIECIVRVTG